MPQPRGHFEGAFDVCFFNRFHFLEFLKYPMHNATLSPFQSN